MYEPCAVSATFTLALTRSNGSPPTSIPVAVSLITPCGARSGSKIVNVPDMCGTSMPRTYKWSPAIVPLTISESRFPTAIPRIVTRPVSESGFDELRADLRYGRRDPSESTSTVT